MFGKLLSRWVSKVYDAIGKPEKVHLVELGPGTGKLARPLMDALPEEVRRAVQLHMIEMSPKLRVIQSEELCVRQVSRTMASVGNYSEMNTYRLPFRGGFVSIDHDCSLEVSDHWEARTLPTWSGRRDDPEATLVTWHEHIGTVPEGPLIVIANEFFDALPTHQFSWNAQNCYWEQICVATGCKDDSENGNSGLEIVKKGCPQPSIQLDGISKSDILNGDGFELSPECLRISRALSERLERFKGAALVIDYGAEEPHDTIRALSRERGASPGLAATLPLLERPGQVDITADVHFGGLSLAMGIDIGLLQPQSYLLTSLMGEDIYDYMGIIRRGFYEGMPPEEEEIYHLTPLVNRQSIGSLFKCICAYNGVDMVPLPGYELHAKIQSLEKKMNLPT